VLSGYRGIKENGDLVYEKEVQEGRYRKVYNLTNEKHSGLGAPYGEGRALR